MISSSWYASRAPIDIRIPSTPLIGLGRDDLRGLSVVALVRVRHLQHVFGRNFADQFPGLALDQANQPASGLAVQRERQLAVFAEKLGGVDGMHRLDQLPVFGLLLGGDGDGSGRGSLRGGVQGCDIHFGFSIPSRRTGVRTASGTGSLSSSYRPQR